MGLDLELGATFSAENGRPTVFSALLTALLPKAKLESRARNSVSQPSSWKISRSNGLTPVRQTSSDSESIDLLSGIIKKESTWKTRNFAKPLYLTQTSSNTGILKSPQIMQSPWKTKNIPIPVSESSPRTGKSINTTMTPTWKTKNFVNPKRQASLKLKAVQPSWNTRDFKDPTKISSWRTKNLMTPTRPPAPNTEALENYNAMSRGWGDDIDWNISIQLGLRKGRLHRKPVMLVVHKSTCPACRKLRAAFSKNDEIKALSRSLVMVNLYPQEVPMNTTYYPDGNYVPRVLFFDPHGDFLRSVVSGNFAYKYNYSNSHAVAKNMKRVINREY